jgi:NADPH2:quinone reductase
LKAIVVREHGDPDVMCIEDVEAQDLDGGSVRLRQEAAGVNFIDIYERTGVYPTQLPFTPGREGAGVVEVVGAEVSDFSPGDRVAYAMHRGAYAETADVPAAKLVAVPDGIELSVAASAMLQGMTAHYLSHDTYSLGPGDTALVHAAAGGVGQLLVQMAHRLGARVIGTVSTEEKAELARAAGADYVILYTQADFLRETIAYTEGRGVDVVYDSVGRNTFEQSLECVRPRGTLALYGQSSGPVGRLDPQILNRQGSIFLTRPSLGHHVADRDELLARAGDLFRWILAGELDVRMDRAFPLEDAPEAHRYMKARRTRGKVLLTPS